MTKILAPRIEILPLTSDHAEASLGVLCTSFLDEPSMRFLNIPYEDLHRLFEPLVRLTIQDGLSLVLLENGKCVSAMLNDDFSEAYESIAMPAALRPLFDFLTLLHDNPVEKEMRRLKKRCFHFFCGGTIPEGRKKGYLGMLSRVGYEHARNRRFDYVLVEATSPYTQRLCRNQGFELMHSAPNASFPAFAAMTEDRIDLMRLAL